MFNTDRKLSGGEHLRFLEVKKEESRGNRAGESFKYLKLDFVSGLAPRTVGLSPVSISALGMESA